MCLSTSGAGTLANGMGRGVEADTVRALVDDLGANVIPSIVRPCHRSLPSAAFTLGADLYIEGRESAAGGASPGGMCSARPEGPSSCGVALHLFTKATVSVGNYA